MYKINIISMYFIKINISYFLSFISLQDFAMLQLSTFDVWKTHRKIMISCSQATPRMDVRREFIVKFESQFQCFDDDQILFQSKARFLNLINCIFAVVSIKTLLKPYESQNNRVVSNDGIVPKIYKFKSDLQLTMMLVLLSGYVNERVGSAK